MKIKIGEKYYLRRKLLFPNSKCKLQVLKAVVVRKLSKKECFVEVKHYKADKCNKTILCLTSKILKQGVKVVTN